MHRLSATVLGGAIIVGLFIAEAHSQENAALSTARGSQEVNLARTTYALRTQNQNYLLSAFAIAGDGSNGADNTVQPGVALWNQATGTAVESSQVNQPPNGNYTTARSDHDAPSMVRTSDGAYLLMYGAASTYAANRPPESWACPSGFCQPFKFAPASVAASIVKALVDSPEYLLPTTGLSEASVATIGDVTVIEGQEQGNSRSGQSGAQGYVTLHGSSTFDTAAGPWNFTSSHTPPGNGLSTITLTPNDDAYFDFGIVQASTGTGMVALSIGGRSCSMSLSSNGDAQAVAQSLAQAFAGTCSALSSQFGAMQVQYDPTLRFEGRVLAPAAIGITLKNGNVRELPGATAIRLSCSGAVSCGSARGIDKVSDVRQSGLHRHFLFGGAISVGQYIYSLMDVEILTGTWMGAAHNAYGLNIACFRSQGPQYGRWTWTNCSGRYPFTVAPGMRAEDRLGSNSPYFVRPPVGGYPADMTPYIYDMRMEAQPPFGTTSNYPVTSAKTATGLANGDVMIVHGCQTRTGTLTVCYAIIDPKNDQTTAAGIVTQPSARGSLASVALKATATTINLAVMPGRGDRWACATRGACLVLFRYSAPTRAWQRISSQSLSDEPDSGFPGTVAPSDRGFVAQVRQRATGAHATLRTFEKDVP